MRLSAAGEVGGLHAEVDDAFQICILDDEIEAVDALSDDRKAGAALSGEANFVGPQGGGGKIGVERGDDGAEPGWGFDRERGIFLADIGAEGEGEIGGLVGVGNLDYDSEPDLALAVVHGIVDGASDGGIGGVAALGDGVDDFVGGPATSCLADDDVGGDPDADVLGASVEGFFGVLLGDDEVLAALHGPVELVAVDAEGGMELGAVAAAGEQGEAGAGQDAHK